MKTTKSTRTKSSKRKARTKKPVQPKFWIGPIIPGTLLGRCKLFAAGGLPASVSEFLAAHPFLHRLLVDGDKFQDAQTRIKNHQPPEFQDYQRALELSKELAGGK